jgi:PAS domain S-box-containing protein
MVSTQVIIPGYHILEELYNGSRTQVYRGIRENDEKPVVIKLLKNPYPNFSELVQFRNQYTIAKNLNYKGIIQTYSLENYQNGYALVMEDMGGISLSKYFTNNVETRYIETRYNALRARFANASLQEFLKIAISLCDILDILYRHRIIHKDIKPANILINPETKQVKLIDFSIASLLPKETQTVLNANVLEGTLSYISPEQTGRMNRGIDYRTDFYSLGVTFYELLTGELPFKSNDAMELVHCHIAKQPPKMKKPHPNPLLTKERVREIPHVLSDIVIKLMAKNAEDRYQSALGLKQDLEFCLKQLQETGKIEDFEIAQRDICDRFIIPEKLYGRESEVEGLLAAFDRVTKNKTELMLVTGFSGIGKTAIVNEVHKPIVKQRGYFIKGKFDQFNRNIPFSAFVQAFRDLMGQLTTESDAQLSSWKHQILQALGENGQVIIEVIPELEQIIGKQPTVPELSGTAAQNRFNLLFQKFIQVFTTPYHPLVIFLDDLQWADSASLNLIQLLMSESESRYLLLIGAYRDNEVFPAHPLMLTLEEISSSQGIINTITLLPLSEENLNQLVADTLNCFSLTAQPLTQLIYQKTQGNPFFSTQFLKALHEDGFIEFDFDVKSWKCDITKVTDLALTDDVVEFMALQLQKLPESTQNILKLAACIGNQFDLTTLAIVCQKSEAETAADLWKALQEGLIIPQSEIYKFYLEEEARENSLSEQIVNYKFLHDRVQQAAYFLIPSMDKQKTHLKIGLNLLNNISKQEQEKKIFDLVNQLNIGLDLITESAQKEELARLNLIASRKAKDATAYVSAAKYAEKGRLLLPENSWNHQYELTLLLHQLETQIAYLTGDFYRMEQLANQVLQNTKTTLDKVKIYEVRIEAYTIQKNMLGAVNTGLEILQMLGIEFPNEPFSTDIDAAFNETAIAMANRKPCELLELPKMQKAKYVAAMRIMMHIVPCIHVAKPELFPLISLKQISLSLTYGNAPTSSFAYTVYAVLLWGAVGDIVSAYEFAQLALDLLSRSLEKSLKPRTIFAAYSFIMHWKQHLALSSQPLVSAYSNSLELGDLAYAGYCAYTHSLQGLYLGKPLNELDKEIANFSEVLKKINQINTFSYNEIFRQAVLNLVGDAENPIYLIGKACDETTQIPLFENAHDGQGLAFLFINKLFLNYLFGDFQQAVENAVRMTKYLDAITAMYIVSIYYFYDSLTHFQVFPFVTEDEQTAIFQRVTINQKKLEIWAMHAPMNYQHKYELVEAEKHRVLGQKTQAIEYYDKAISGAKANKYIQEEALANELAAKFYLDWGKEKVAGAYMQEAYYCYAKWGAKAKTDDLEKRYSQLLAPILQAQKYSFQINETYFQTNQTIQTSRSSSSVCDTLDFASMLKATQALSKEIELEELISTLLQIVIENAGAEKAALVFLKEDILNLEAIATKDNGVTHLSIPYETSRDIPNTVINYAKRSLKTVVLDNAQVQNDFITDKYLIQQQPYSLLCVPILNKGKLIGLLYLENKLTIGAFTRERLEVINLLCTQAAISLENARLHAQEKEKSYQLEQSQQRLKLIIQKTPVAVIEWNTDFNFQTWNPAAEKIFGYRAEEILGQHFRWIVPEEYHVYVDDVATQILTQSGGTHAINENVTKDSFRITCEWFNAPMLNSNGEVCGGVSMVLDITDRKQAEAAVILKSQELEKALQELNQAQLQMVQNEKMATLGNLVAGVAHEVNNPIGFLKGSISNAEEYIKDLFAHIECYQENYPTPEEDIIENAEDIDLEFLTEDLPKLLDSMRLATERIKDISTSLRTFSRADTSEKVACNIHEGIDSTILILKYRLKANEKRPAIEIIKEYGNLPPIKCFLGQLNQVFMNIIANAIDALDMTNEGKTFAKIQENPHQITINTEVCTGNNTVLIKIKDNGSGMPESVRERIFDNLFTTKGVGKGTGLGLAIAREIVEETHNGKLSCNSNLGEGTEFIIELPIN